MCVIAVIPSGVAIDDDIIKDMCETNPHGCGIAWSAKGKLKVAKGLWTVEKTIKIMRAVEEVAEGDIVFHCRISTHGKVTVENCHPFWISDDTVMFHNGVLNFPILSNFNRSDTYHFAEFLKSSLQKKSKYRSIADQIRSDDLLISAIEDWHGQRNKLCFLTDNGKSVLTGDWFTCREGIKYSNTDFIDRTQAVKDFDDWVESIRNGDNNTEEFKEVEMVEEIEDASSVEVVSGTAEEVEIESLDESDLILVN